MEISRGKDTAKKKKERTNSYRKLDINLTESVYYQVRNCIDEYLGLSITAIEIGSVICVSRERKAGGIGGPYVYTYAPIEC